MNSSEQKIFNEIMVETKWQDYLCEQLNKKWDEFKKSLNDKYFHDKSYHTSQGSSATIRYGGGGTRNRGGKDFPNNKLNEWNNIKNSLNGLTFKKTNRNKYFKYKINNINNI